MEFLRSGIRLLSSRNASPFSDMALPSALEAMQFNMRRVLYAGLCIDNLSSSDEGRLSHHGTQVRFSTFQSISSPLIFAIQGCDK